MTKILAAGVVLALLSSGRGLCPERRRGHRKGHRGAVTGAVVGGPVGAVVGGVTGAIAGGIADQNTPKFRQYVVQQNVPSYRYQEDVRVGTVLPLNGVNSSLPGSVRFGATEYRYTVVNNVPVLVEPRTRRMIQVIR